MESVIRWISSLVKGTSDCTGSAVGGHVWSCRWSSVHGVYSGHIWSEVCSSWQGAWVGQVWSARWSKLHTGTGDCGICVVMTR